MGDFGSGNQWEIVFAIVAAAAISCVLGWLLDGGLSAVRQRWLTGRRARPSLRSVGPVEDGAGDFGEEFVRALALAVNSAIESASDEEAVIESIVTHLGWSPTRARWFLAVNREQVEQTVQQMRRHMTDERPPASA